MNIWQSLDEIVVMLAMYGSFLFIFWVFIYKENWLDWLGNILINFMSRK